MVNLIELYSKPENHEIYGGGSSREFHNTAFHSLKIALKAYYSTYNSLLGRLHEKYSSKNLDVWSLTHDYYEHFSEAIVHFQHFFELIIKDILENENPLLAVRATQKPVIFHKLLKNEEILEEEYINLYSVEFSEALKTLIILIDSGRIADSRYTIFKNAKNTLEALNNFRNRIWHRGRFILKYHALEEFICKYVLPLVLKTVKLSEYEKYKSIWASTVENGLKINIIETLISEINEVNINYSKIAFFKELGRIEMMHESKSKLITAKDNIESIKQINGVDGFMVSECGECPFCQQQSLLKYLDVELVYEEYGDELTPNFASMTAYEYKESLIECILCGFTIDTFIDNLSSYGLDDKFKFWDGTKGYL